MTGQFRPQFSLTDISSTSCAAAALPKCSREGVDEQVACVVIPENESVASESPGEHDNMIFSGEQHSPLTECAARRADRHDAVRASG